MKPSFPRALGRLVFAPLVLAPFVVASVLAASVLVASVLVGSSSCATSPEPASRAVPSPSDAAVAVVRSSLVQRVVREAPAVTRSGVARLVTLVPLDEERVGRLASAVGRALSADRLEAETAARIEAVLAPDELQELDDALLAGEVRAVIDAALAADPAASDLARFVDDPAALPEERRAKVRALVELTWSPDVVDRLSRAPVAAAGRIVAAATKDGDVGRRDELLRIAEAALPGNPEALVVAFAFLWRDLDDETLEAARAFFASDLGVRSTKALVDAVLAAIAAVAVEVEAEVRE